MHGRGRLQRAVPPRGRARARTTPATSSSGSGQMIDEVRRLMPRRTDIETILVIGSGPIVIGQACEFDYSGTQACRVLRAEGYRVVLVNSNPATIMTDPDDRRPDLRGAPRPRRADAPWSSASGPTPCCPPWAGQTGLNLAFGLSERGVLDAFGVELIGANAEAIATAEDRDRFKTRHGGDRPRGARLGLRHASRRGHGPGRAHRLPAHDPPQLHPGRGGHRDGRRPRRAGQGGGRGPGGQPGAPDPDRALHRGMEGIRARGHARPRGQLRRGVLDRELRPHGRAHRRLDHRRPGPDPVRRRVPGHARRRLRLHPARRAWRPGGRTSSSRCGPPTDGGSSSR